MSSSAMNRVLQWATFHRTWWIYDASHQCPFKSAHMLAYVLQGRHKPIYHPLSDIGDHVVVINTKHISMKNELWRTWKYHHHTSYPKGKSITSAWRLHELDPTKIMYKAIYSTLPGNLLRPNMIRRTHLYEEEDVPIEILRNVSDQLRQLQPVPKYLDDYSKEEIESFPKLFDWPSDYAFEEPDQKA
ncbi:39S ribosomal protein L13, mitochondrial [Octopus bimaculoides]|uniref:39S ribosomal protein L13, mitochondrial n=1 Tax=Octopus bimaculoides TaxID=37653 RepID=A0A0L8FL24_OCTBM|nr:39S ribosomal protein L13, mitochondrial [Octopus bimaculoides]|eukprot:XP_014788926.1 PREDICTED: 39S ribosomal protein L13, mitochondrial-like [Octopus bimaculoides]